MAHKGSVKKTATKKRPANLPGNAIDITGQQFGDLTALRPLGSRGAEGIIWLCECVCGKHAKRSAGHLRHAVKKGVEPCCQTCLEELRGGFFENRRLQRKAGRDRRREYLRKLWNEEGTLYSSFAVDFMVEDVRETLYQEYGFVPETSAESDLRSQVHTYGFVAVGVGWSPPARCKVSVADDADIPEDELPGTETGPLPLPESQKPSSQWNEAAREAAKPKPSELEQSLKRHKEWIFEKAARQLAEEQQMQRAPKKKTPSFGWDYFRRKGD